MLASMPGFGLTPPLALFLVGVLKLLYFVVVVLPGVAA